VHPENSGDQCARGLNYITARPRSAILEDYKHVLTQIYDPAVYCARLERMIGMLKLTREPRRYPAGDPRRKQEMEAAERVLNTFPEWRDLLTGTFSRSFRKNPRAVRQIVQLLALFLHLIPYAQKIIAETDKAIAEVDTGKFAPPPLVPTASEKEGPLALSA